MVEVKERGRNLEVQPKLEVHTKKVVGGREFAEI